MKVSGFLFQTRDPLLQDVRIRRAFLMALDVPQLVDATTDGESKPSLSIVPLPSPYYGKRQAELPAPGCGGCQENFWPRRATRASRSG